MKNLQVLLIFIGVLIGNHAYSQDVFISKEQSFSLRASVYDIIGKIDDRIYTYRSTTSDYFIDIYDDTMHHLASVTLDFLPKETEATHFAISNNEIYVIYKFEEKGMHQYYAARLDKKGMLINKPVFLDSQSKSWLSNQAINYEAIFSEDKTKFVIIARGGDSKKNQLAVKHFDNNFNNIQETTYHINKEDIVEFMPLISIQLANNGTIVLPAFSLNNTGRVIYSSLFKMELGESTYSKFPINTKDIYLSDYYFKIDNNTNICYILSLYSESRGGNIEGTMIQKFHLSQDDFFLNKKNPFPDDFLKSVKAKNWRRAFNNYKGVDIVVKKDGGWVLISEDQSYSIRNQYNNSYYGNDVFSGNPYFFGNNIREYKFNDISVLNYDSTGTLIWSEHIRKNQYSQEDGGLFGSFGMLNSGAHLVFLFNNLNSLDHSISIGSINLYGKLEMARINHLDKNALWIMRFGKQVALKEYIVPVLKNDNLAFARIVF